MQWLLVVICASSSLGQSLCERLSVIVTTNPISRDPEASLVISTLEYLRKFDCLRDVPFFVNLHINPDRSEEQGAELFAKFLKQAIDASPSVNQTNLVVSRMRSTEASFAHVITLVSTKYYLFWEHDWRLCRDVDIARVLEQMEQKPDINYVRFNKKRNDITPKEYDFVLSPCKDCDLIPLLFTPSWSNNPHIARKEFVVKKCLPLVSHDENRETYLGFFEWPITWRIAAYTRANGVENASASWGTYLFGEMGDGHLVYHLNGANFNRHVLALSPESACDNKPVSRIY